MQHIILFVGPNVKAQPISFSSIWNTILTILPPTGPINNCHLFRILPQIRARRVIHCVQIFLNIRLSSDIFLLARRILVKKPKRSSPTSVLALRGKAYIHSAIGCAGLEEPQRNLSISPVPNSPITKLSPSSSSPSALKANPQTKPNVHQAGNPPLKVNPPNSPTQRDSDVRSTIGFFRIIVPSFIDHEPPVTKYHLTQQIGPKTSFTN